jgi:Uma2 family endonuclease
MAVAMQRRLFTVAEYYTMLEAGILTEDDRVELIEGEIVEMAAIGSRHASCVKRLNDLLVSHLRERALVAVQDPVHLSDISEPEPDVSVLRRRDDYYAGAHPGPADIFLLIEVADASLLFDRKVKIPLYAASGIPEVWLIDLTQAILEVYRKPEQGTYREVLRLRAGSTVSPAAFPDQVWDVSQLIG